MSDVKSFLRKYEFPTATKEALTQLEHLCCRASSAQHQRLSQDIIDEFVFCEIELDRRGMRKKRLNALQELQILEILCHYFSNQHNEVVRNTMFLTLFHYEGGTSSKTNILVKIVSLSIATKNTSILSCSSVWMQQQGCTSDVVVSLVRDVIVDYFQFVPKATDFMVDLPHISANFVANFMTAATALYDGSDNGTGMFLNLLQLMTRWVTSNPHLCLMPLTANYQNALPRGSIVMPPTTPLPGLIRWCILTPLQNARTDNSKSIATALVPSEDALYSQLFTGILETMMASREVHHQMAQKEILSLRDFLGLIEHLTKLMNKKGRTVHSSNVQTALDRFGQVLQVALATHCIQGSVGELNWYLKELPDHRLLKMIMERNKHNS